jgi:hypothetical protein
VGRIAAKANIGKAGIVARRAWPDYFPNKPFALSVSQAIASSATSPAKTPSEASAGTDKLFTRKARTIR